MSVIIFCRDSFEMFDLMLVVICFALFLPLIHAKASFICQIMGVSYNAEPKNIVTKTFSVAITAFCRVFGSSNK